MMWSLMFILTGAFFNTIVIEKNNCKMPVLGSGYLAQKYRDSHFFYQQDQDIKHPYLADRFEFPKRHHFSLGDVLMSIGLLSFMVMTIKQEIKFK